MLCNVVVDVAMATMAECEERLLRDHVIEWMRIKETQWFMCTEERLVTPLNIRGHGHRHCIEGYYCQVQVMLNGHGNCN